METTEFRNFDGSMIDVCHLRKLPLSGDTDRFQLCRAASLQSGKIKRTNAAIEK